MPTRHEYTVTFYSPGTMVSETTEKSIERPDTDLAVEMAGKIIQRHGARPYAFRFSTFLVCDEIDQDGETFQVKPKLVSKSGLYYIGGPHEVSLGLGSASDERSNGR